MIYHLSLLVSRLDFFEASYNYFINYKRNKITNNFKMFITWIRGQRICIVIVLNDRLVSAPNLNRNIFRRLAFHSVGIANRHYLGLDRIYLVARPWAVYLCGIPTITIGHRNNWTKLYNISPSSRRGRHNNNYCSYYGTHPHCCAHPRIYYA